MLPSCLESSAILGLYTHVGRYLAFHYAAKSSQYKRSPDNVTLADIVPFYGMGKRSSGDYGFLPGSFGNYRGDSKRSLGDYGFLPGSYRNYRGDSQLGGGGIYKRGGGEPSVLEVRKRSGYLASYCCLQLRDDDCCQLLGVTPYFGKRSSEVYDEPAADYEFYEEDDCFICLEKSTFDYEYCLQCVKKK